MMLFPEHLADRYRRFKYRHFAPNLDYYEELARNGQNPDVMIVSCCDSRVDPETIFSAMPGELFVVRNVANIVPPYETDGRYHGVSAALEFAALNLRVKHIVVMGHSGCGGIRACLEQSAARQSEAQFISNWMSILEEGRQKVLQAGAGRSIPELRTELERVGIKISLRNLRSFPCVKTLESKGRLHLHGAYFDIATGSLFVLNEATDEFVPI
ncbi:MAG: carbonate dehydratase [Proteobacteria bacterium]|jgi:carbonic anhydrase|nr:MAG: carbonate dehydratase [Pseudomonadota bacterium]